MIKVRYSSIDRFSKTGTFKTIESARKFAWKWVGRHPELGWGYAVSADGVGKVTVEGATLADLFPPEPKPVFDDGPDYVPYEY